MAVLIECPGCHRRQSQRNIKCRKCGVDLDTPRMSNRIIYWIAYHLPKRNDQPGKLKLERVGSSIRDAEAADGKRKGQKKEGRIFDIKKEIMMTFNELSEWYLGLTSIKKKKYYWLLEIKLKKFNSEFGNRVVSDIKPSEIEDYRAKRTEEGMKPATIDSEITAVKTMVRKAFNDDLVSGDTLKVFSGIKKLLKKNANARDKILSREEYNRLYQSASSHLQQIIATGYFTGMREGEILNLIWDKVFLEKRLIKLDARITKDKEARSIPICDELYALLKRIPRAIHDPHVFLFKGKPIRGGIQSSLRQACRKAKIPYGRFVEDGFVFHDLRHTFNTNMVEAGVPEKTIMEITGHSTREMFDRYTTVTEKAKQRAMNRLEEHLKSDEAKKS
jgi:integrase